MPGASRASGCGGLPSLSLFNKTITDSNKNPLGAGFVPILAIRYEAMNIPSKVARAQGHHGIKGAKHGIKGGRPRLDLTDEERAQRRRKQQEAYRRSKGIQPRETTARRGWGKTYYDIWGKAPGEPLTPEEFAAREPLWIAWIGGSKREEEGEKEKPVQKIQTQGERRVLEYWMPPVAPLDETPPVGRNQPCPCGSGRKSKKCCGR
jgi:hypothetical protein